MNYRDARPDQRQTEVPEMCEQFTQLFINRNDTYVGEECLLKVLLKREGYSPDQLEMPGMPPDVPSATDHMRRRQMIFHILGMKATASDKTPDQKNELVTS